MFLSLTRERLGLGLTASGSSTAANLSPVSFVPYPRQLRAAHLPVVLVDRQYDKHSTSFVGINNADSAVKGTEYLVGKGLFQDRIHRIPRDCLHGTAARGQL
jgi:hypothetical protein